MLRKRYILFEVLLLIVLLIIYLNIGTLYSKTIGYFTILICITQSYFIIKTGSKYYVRPVLIFLMSFIIVNCQIYIDLLLNNVTVTYNGFINPNTINKGMLLSAIGFTSFGLGYNLIEDKQYTFNTKFVYSRSLYNILKRLNILIFILWLSQLSINDFTGESYLNSGAYDVTETKYTDLLFSISQIIIFSYIAKIINFKVSIGSIHKLIPFSIFGPSIFYVLIKLMSGDRGGAIFISFLLFYFIILVTKIRIKLKYILPIILFGALIMTSISFSRQMGNELSFSEKLTYIFDNVDLLDEKKSFLSPTRELANSNNCIHIALDEINNKHKAFHYGEFHLCYILNCIPLISNPIIKELGIEKENRLSSEYITIAYSGKQYQSGLGTSTIADNYLEFGVIGVIVGLIIIGVIFRFVDNVIINCNANNIPMIYILFALTMCYASLSIPRAYYFFYFRLFLYIYVIYKILELIIMNKSLK